MLVSTCPPCMGRPIPQLTRGLQELNGMTMQAPDSDHSVMGADSNTATTKHIVNKNCSGEAAVFKEVGHATRAVAVHELRQRL